MTRRAALAIAGLAACSVPDDLETPKPGPPSGSARAPIELTVEKMPDASWSEAARSASQHWHETFAKSGVKRVTMSPFASPDGVTVPYLMRAKGFDGRGVVVFDGTALVHDGKLLNGSGKAAVERYLASLKYPQVQIPLGHLVEILDATRTVEPTWVRAPSRYGWDFTTLQGSTKHVPASVVYDDMGSATLTLLRDGKRVPGTRPRLEKLSITIGHDASLTISGP